MIFHDTSFWNIFESSTRRTFFELFGHVRWLNRKCSKCHPDLVVQSTTQFVDWNVLKIQLMELCPHIKSENLDDFHFRWLKRVTQENDINYFGIQPAKIKRTVFKTMEYSKQIKNDGCLAYWNSPTRIHLLESNLIDLFLIVSLRWHFIISFKWKHFMVRKIFSIQMICFTLESQSRFQKIQN